uniref:Uncharacterized protein n=1 Tax=Ascaris lumbricoides TaxID=6252 RepID=A0A0M3HT69_ASCLU
MRRISTVVTHSLYWKVTLEKDLQAGGRLPRNSPSISLTAEAQPIRSRSTKKRKVEKNPSLMR